MDTNIPPKMHYLGDALTMDTAPMSDESLDAIKDAISTLEKAYMRACKASAMPPSALSELKVTYLSQLLRLETIIMTEQKRPKPTMDEVWDKAIPVNPEKPFMSLAGKIPFKQHDIQETSQKEPQDVDTEEQRDLCEDEEETEDGTEDSTW